MNLTNEDLINLNNIPEKKYSPEKAIKDRAIMLDMAFNLHKDLMKNTDDWSVIK